MFTVMTWNVENLFRPPGPGGAAQPAYQAKLDSLAGTINTAGPDLLALQEIGGQDALDDLTGRLTGAWHSRLSTHPDGRGIRVAFLSRQPLTDPVDVVDYPTGLPPVHVDDAGTTVTALGRGALAVTTTTTAPGGTAVRAVTTHLKSKLLSYPGGRFSPRDEDERARYAAYALFRRAAEAATVRHYLTAALAGAGPIRPLLLLGDLNDTPDAATTQLLLGPPGSEIGTRGFTTPDRGDGQRMWNLAPLMPEGKDYSRINNGRPELIDHILVSAALVRTAADVAALTDQPLPSVTADPGARQDAPASDHAPVVATFTA